MSMKRSNSQESEQAWDLVRALQEYLRVKLCQVFKAEDDEFSMVYWLRDEGRHGGGQRQEAKGQSFFNRASINVSQVQYEDDENKRLRAATAISTIIHPANPWLPSIHMHISWTEMKDGNGYWRLMADLNPSIPDLEDRELFIDALKNASGNQFEVGRKQGDQYFYIPALQRHRGVSHFYLENFNSGDFDSDLTFAHKFGQQMIDCYGAILARALAKNKIVKDEDKAQQLDYHTAYFLQVVTLDRGTTSGLLVHNQNDVGTLGSIPSHISRHRLFEWISKLPTPQNKLLERLIAVLPESNPAHISPEVKIELANKIREFYQEFPHALELQAKGFVIPETVVNHTQESS